MTSAALLMLLQLSLTWAAPGPGGQDPSNTAATSARTVVIMDAAISTEPMSGRPYLELIAETLKPVNGISIVQEPVTADPQRDDAVVAMNPAVVIIHINAFTLLTNDATGHTRFVQLLGRFRSRPTQFILYSRSPAFASSHATEYVIQTTATSSGIAPSRVTTFAPNQDGPRGVMRNDRAYTELQATVEKLAHAAIVR